MKTKILSPISHNRFYINSPYLCTHKDGGVCDHLPRGVLPPLPRTWMPPRRQEDTISEAHRGQHRQGRWKIIEFLGKELNLGVITSANGSAIVRMGETTVIAGVRAEVGDITTTEIWEMGQDGPEVKEKPSILPLIVSVELLPLCSPQFRQGRVCSKSI